MSHAAFWVLYDYGQGVLWAIVRARSSDEIRARYPQLQVYDAPPEALDESARERVRCAGIQDIDGPPEGWLKELTTSGSDG